MDKILAINTIKNVFSALGAKTSDSNYAVALLDKTSAEPKGMMDFANLASVLGVIRYGEVLWNQSVSDYNNVYAGTYRVGTGITNGPSDHSSGNAFLIVFGNPTMGCQILIGVVIRKVWLRAKNKSTDDWTSWMSVDLT